MKSYTTALKIALVSTCLGFAHTVAAADFPSQPLHLLVGFPPGGSTDLVARILAEGLTEELDQAVIVENRPGAGGTIAAGQTAKAKADGHTIFLGTVATNVINPILHQESIQFDPINDFTMIGQVGYYTNVILVNNEAPYENLAELIEDARTNDLNYSSPGAGTSPHLTGEYFKLQTNTNLHHIPFSGSGPALTALLGNHVEVGFENLPAALNMIRSNQLKALAITSDERVEDLPDTPTTSEQGVPDMAVDAWVSIMGPQGIPTDRVQRLSDALIKVLNDDQTVDKLKAQGVTLKPTTPEELLEYIQLETKKWEEVIQKANIEIAN